MKASEQPCWYPINQFWSFHLRWLGFYSESNEPAALRLTIDSIEIFTKQNHLGTKKSFVYRLHCNVEFEISPFGNFIHLGG